MAVELLVNFALEKALETLFEAITDVKDKAKEFKPELEKLKSTIELLQPMLKEIDEMKSELNQNEGPTKELLLKIQEGQDVVRNCSNVRWWCLCRKREYTNRLLELNESLKNRMLTVPLENARDLKQILIVTQHNNVTNVVVNQLKSSLPGLPTFTVGLQVPLNELKRRFLREETSVLVVTAPVGCGKTTLAAKFCQDEEVQEKFKKSVFFINISKKPSMIHIIQAMVEGRDRRAANLQGDEDATEFLKELVKQRGPVLLTLDDAKSGSESLIEKFLQVPECKVLVTSRIALLGLGNTYYIELLNDYEAMMLFQHWASLNDGSSHIPKKTVKQIVKPLRKCPLALEVVGKSLRGQPVEIWQARSKSFSKGLSIVEDTDSGLLDRLKSSLDDLEGNKAILKECFMDLGSFPEDLKIVATALIDIWSEQYDKLEEDSNLAIAKLYDLVHRSLVNLIITRKDVNEGDGYYSEHFVTQHDLLRELAIHQSSLDPLEQRKRLIMDLSGSNFPKWWNEEKELPIMNARLLSITTDENFSMKWREMQLPHAEVLVLNFQTTNYPIPEFIETMHKLKVMIMTNYHYLQTELSNFHLLGSLTHLKRIRLERISIPSLSKTYIQLVSLKNISLFMCKIGPSFRDSSFNISNMFPNLVEINIDFCSDLVELPFGLCDMHKLNHLSITHCHNLLDLPEKIGNLENLKLLRLRSCTDLSKLPDSIKKLSKLTFLDISNCFSLRKLPEDIGELCNLRKINIKDCTRLQWLPDSILELENLEEAACDEEVKEIWESMLPCDTITKIKVPEEDINLNWLFHRRS